MHTQILLMIQLTQLCGGMLIEFKLTKNENVNKLLCRSNRGNEWILLFLYLSHLIENELSNQPTTLFLVSTTYDVGKKDPVEHHSPITHIYDCTAKEFLSEGVYANSIPTFLLIERIPSFSLISC